MKERIEKGLFPSSGDFCEELHAMGQYIQDGTPLLFETFLDVQGKILAPVADMLEDGFDYLNGKEFWDINKASFGEQKGSQRKTALSDFRSGKIGCLCVW